MIIEQKISTILRHYPKDAVHGDPYDYSWNLLYHDRYTVEILGVHVAPTLNQSREMIEFLRSLGVKKLIVNRHGRLVEHILDKTQDID